MNVEITSWGDTQNRVLEFGLPAEFERDSDDIGYRCIQSFHFCFQKEAILACDALILLTNQTPRKSEFNFILYGGEFIALTKKNDRKKIHDVYDKVQELINITNTKN